MKNGQSKGKFCYKLGINQSLGMIGSGGSAMGRAGAAILAQNMSAKSNFDAQSTYSTVSKLPFSFKTAIDQIEEEILALASEVSYGKKEVEILKTELETI